MTTICNRCRHLHPDYRGESGHLTLDSATGATILEPHEVEVERTCTICGTTEGLMDERDRCWECNDEIRREQAIEARADRLGHRY